MSHEPITIIKAVYLWWQLDGLIWVLRLEKRSSNPLCDNFKDYLSVFLVNLHLYDMGLG